MNPRLPLDESATRRALRHFALEADFDFFAYLYLRGPESFAVSNYPTEWQLLYVEKDYIRVDPVVTMARHGPPIFLPGRRRQGQRMGHARTSGKSTRMRRNSASRRVSISAPVGLKNQMVFTPASGRQVPVDVHVHATIGQPMRVDRGRSAPAPGTPSRESGIWTAGRWPWLRRVAMYRSDEAAIGCGNDDCAAAS